MADPTRPYGLYAYSLGPYSVWRVLSAALVLAGRSGVQINVRRFWEAEEPEDVPFVPEGACDADWQPVPPCPATWGTVPEPPLSCTS
jgi:hypothetical protein